MKYSLGTSVALLTAVMFSCEAADEDTDGGGAGQAGDTSAPAAQGGSPSSGGNSAGSGGDAPEAGAPGAGGDSGAPGSGGLGGEGATASATGGSTDGGDGGEPGAAGASPGGACVPASPNWTGSLLSSVDAADWITKLAVNPCGELLAVANNAGSGGTPKEALVRVAPDGTREGDAVLPPETTGSVRAITADAGGDFYLAINRTGNAQLDTGVVVAKLSRSGRVLWSTLLESADASVRSIALDAASNVIIAGHAGSDLALQLPDRAGSGFIAKLSSDGTHLWTTRPTGNVADVDPEGFVYVAARALEGTTAPQAATHLLKLDPDGETVWDAPLPLPLDFLEDAAELGLDSVEPGEIAVSGDGRSIFVSGRLSASECSGPCPSPSVIGKFDAVDGFLWSVIPHDDASVVGFEVVELATNTAGTSLFASSATSLVVRYDSADERAWGYTPPEPFYVATFALDASGDPILAGSATPSDASPTNSTDWALLRLNAANGMPR